MTYEWTEHLASAQSPEGITTMKRGVEDTGHGMWDTKENLSQERPLIIPLPLFPRWEMIFC